MRWTLEEDQVVLTCVKRAIADGGMVSTGAREASRRIDRPYVHVMSRWYQRLRYDTPREQRARTNPRSWTETEESALRDAVAAADKAGVSRRSAIKDVAKQIGRSQNAVAQHLTIMRAGGLL